VTLHLSAEQSQSWDMGGWLSLELQETLLEDIERAEIQEAVIVRTAEGQLAFSLTPARV
jgi:hypothetical protein